MRNIQFALIREGTSDDGLADIIRALLGRAGVGGVIGAPRDYQGTTKVKLEKLLAEEISPDLIFVHRDSDSRDASARHDEIALAARELGCESKVIAVVPIQETEAWLLTDEAAIRAVVGRPSGRNPLGLPAVRDIEKTSDPKSRLEDACRIACEKTGVRLKRESREFPRYRTNLLQRLDIDGPVNELSSWRKFVHDLNAAASRVMSETPER
jgi:hypothetical protein